MKIVFSKFFAVFALLVMYQLTVRSQCNVGEAELMVQIQTDNWGYEGYWQLTSASDNCGVNVILEGGNIAQIGCAGGGNQDATLGNGYGDNSTFFSAPVCLMVGEEYTLHYIDDWGDGGMSFDLLIAGFPVYEFQGTGIGGTFNFIVEEASQYDVEAISVLSYSYVNPTEIEVKGKFFNRGTEVINSVDFTFNVDGGSDVVGTIDGLNVQPFTEFILVHPTMWMEEIAGNYELQIGLSAINGNADQQTDNDLASKIIAVGPPIPNVLDDYIGVEPLSEEIAGPAQNISHPRDLDFHPNLNRSELWVILKSTENSGGLTVKISDAGRESQSELLQQDGNAWHFMSLPTGIAFSENENFATSPGVYDANHDGGMPFTGPTLWSSDPLIYAQESGGNGSHLDMLHESPYSMGIAHEVDNKFWVTCGDHNEIMSYDFQEDHGPGNSDHSDGIIYKYHLPGYDEDPTQEIPDHLVFDKNTGWLYVCNSQQNRVVRINTATGTPGMEEVPSEPVAIYQHMDDFEWEVYIDAGLNAPTGIDIVEDRMIVSNYNSGDILLYDISTEEPVLLTTVSTGQAGIMGIKVGPDGLIWYVNSITDQVMRVLTEPVGVVENSNTPKIKLMPNPANTNLNLSVSTLLSRSAEYSISDISGRVVAQAQLGSNQQMQIDVSSLANGVYMLTISDPTNKVWMAEKVVVEH
jgi:hypothetical protein